MIVFKKEFVKIVDMDNTKKSKKLFIYLVVLTLVVIVLIITYNYLEVKKTTRLTPSEYKEKL